MNKELGKELNILEGNTSLVNSCNISPCNFNFWIT